MKIKVHTDFRSVSGGACVLHIAGFHACIRLSLDNSVSQQLSREFNQILFHPCCWLHIAVNMFAVLFIYPVNTAPIFELWIFIFNSDGIPTVCVFLLSEPIPYQWVRSQYSLVSVLYLFLACGKGSFLFSHLLPVSFSSNFRKMIGSIKCAIY